jgi:hypothetical protein
MRIIQLYISVLIARLVIELGVVVVLMAEAHAKNILANVPMGSHVIV